MSLQIKSLFTRDPNSNQPAQASGTDGQANLIPGANAFYILYTASKASGNLKSAIVKGIRLFNDDTSPVSVSLCVNSPPDNTHFSRYHLIPENTLIPAKSTLIDDTEITLGPGDEIQALASAASKIRFLISGVERDVV